MPFEEKIRTAREQRGISQERMAEALGISRQAVSKWETGQSRPDTENLIALSDLLELPLNELTDTVSPQRKSRRLILGFVTISAALLLAFFTGFRLGDKTISSTPDVVVPSTPFAEDTTVESGSVNTLLNSPDSVLLQIAAQRFARAYFSDDADTVELLHFRRDRQTYGNNIWSSLDYLVPKWDPAALSTQNPITLSYQYARNGEDSASYLTLGMLFTDGEWYISSCSVEK